MDTEKKELVASKVSSIFNHLKNDIPGIKGLALVSSDGRILAHDWPGKSLEPDKLGAIGSTLLGFGKKTIEILSTGQLHQVLLQSSDGSIGVFSAGPQMVLMVSMGQESNIGILCHQSRKKAEEISQLLVIYDNNEN